MSGSTRVARGGCWNLTPQYAQVANRFTLTPGYRCDDLGFRLVRIITPAERLGELAEEEKK